MARNSKQPKSNPADSAQNASPVVPTPPAGAQTPAASAPVANVPPTGADSSASNAAGTTKGEKEPLSPTIIAAIITAVGTIIVAFIALIPIFFPPNQSAPPTSNPALTSPAATTSTSGIAVTDAPTPTPVIQVTGAFNLTIIYGGQDSLTIRINSESHLYGLEIVTPSGRETIARSFPVLATHGAVAQTGICLRYIRTDTDPPLPRVCDVATTFENDVLGSAVFWYDDRSNQYQDIALQQDSRVVGLCPHAGGSGRCDFTG